MEQKPPTLNTVGRLVNIVKMSAMRAVTISETFAGETIGKLEGTTQKSFEMPDVTTIETRAAILTGDTIETTTDATPELTIVQPVAREATIVRLRDDIFATDSSSRVNQRGFFFYKLAITILRMEDFYCDEVLSGKTQVDKVLETENVLAYHHTRPFWPTHIVVIPKMHVGSLLTIDDNELLIELLDVVKQIAAGVVKEKRAARVLTNLGEYQDSKHLHFHVNSGDPKQFTTENTE